MILSAREHIQLNRLSILDFRFAISD